LKIIVVPVGRVDLRVLSTLENRLSHVFAGSLCSVSEDVLPLSKVAYNPSRRQYVSTKILSDLLDYAEKTAVTGERVHRVLGVADIDLYVPRLNFVFGEAQCPGKAALISLFRLRPEFYGQPPDERLFHERVLKEAVHELGHTLGLRHCSDHVCVMHFSLHIGMTDRKQARFCEACRPKRFR
jgi:archaemetzincin